jgi:hypothetical protein
MKVVAKFLGRVNEYNNPPALSYVTLKNVDTNEKIDTDAVSQLLLENGLTQPDCEFEILVQETDAGQTVGSITKLESRKSPEEVDANPPSEPPDFAI